MENSTIVFKTRTDTESTSESDCASYSEKYIDTVNCDSDNDSHSGLKIQILTPYIFCKSVNLYKNVNLQSEHL